MTEVDVDHQGNQDLEDGEIESDSEQQQQNDEKTEPSEQANKSETKDSSCDKKTVIDLDSTKKTEKKPDRKKSKEHKEHKEHSKKVDKERRIIEKSRDRSPTPEDDFARNIEKAIKKVLKRGGDSVDDNPEENDDGDPDDSEKRKHKKRKKHEHSDKTKETRKRKHNVDDEYVDENELMCVRGASPVHRHKRSRKRGGYRSDDDNESSLSDASDREHGRDRMHGRMFRGRGGMRDFRDQFRPRFERRYDRHSQQDTEGVCLFYMQGKCYKGDDCVYSHSIHPPRKLELCKFYLMDCCAKRDKCLYLHSDFPCKYYHTGMPCIAKDDCKFAHGKPLSENFKQILLKHIESAPKEILGEFPRLSRETAMLMISNTQNRLKKEFGEGNEKSHSSDEQAAHKNTDESSSENVSREKSKKSKRQSRWRDPSPPNNTILSVQNLNGILTAKQISDLLSMGIKDINQLTNLTVQQLNQLGLTANQINEIQLNSLNIQKLGLIENNASAPSPPHTYVTKLQSKDMDMRVSPALPDIPTIQPPSNESDSLGRDVDMRFQSTHANTINKDVDSLNEPRKKNALDIDQYTKDAMKFGALEKDDYSNTIKSPKEENETKKDLDVDHRLLKYVRDATTYSSKLDEGAVLNTEGDTDIRMSSFHMKQQTYGKSNRNEEKARRITTDDEEDTLQIDEKWYSSDDERADKKLNKENEDAIQTISSPQPMEPTTVLKNLGDLSKIDISDEVSKLLSSIKQSESNPSKKEHQKSRDPRSAAKTVQENKESVGDTKKSTSKPELISIYECRDTDTDIRKADVDLRSKDLDFRMPNFGDTDLRQTPGSGDIDLRLGLPFKAISNYTPATEVDGSITSHPPITYKVRLIDIPKPDYTIIKNSIPVSQAGGDPRLRKIFRLSIDEPPGDTAEKKSSIVRSDPRKRATDNSEKPPKSSPIDIQALLQTSEWYKALSTNHKIMVNQQIAIVTSMLKKFNQDKTPGKTFDLTEIKSNTSICMIFNNLGVALNEKGEYYNTPVQENIPPSPAQMMNFNNPDYMMENMNMMGPGQMNVMGNMGPMGNMNMNMNFNSRYANAPGMPPGMNPNFDNYGGMGNYNSDNYNNFDNNMYNGPGNNGNDYQEDYDDNYYSDQNNDYQNKGYREGRKYDRWNNRGRSRGGRDRRGYTERSKWNDRN